MFKHTDPTAHAKIMAIRDAGENLASDDLENAQAIVVFKKAKKMGLPSKKKTR